MRSTEKNPIPAIPSKRTKRRVVIKYNCKPPGDTSYGSIAPRTALGKAVTMGYAMIGIPLTLLYLSSVGSILSRVARGVFSRALCCCLCSNCGYCCYDEKRMAEKEKKMKKKRQQLELQQQLGLQEPFYVRSNSNYSNNLHSPCRDGGTIKEIDSLSGTDNDSKTSMHGWSILAPILLCLCIMFIYICLGTFALYKLEDWSLLNGFYFCFMSLTTIGFGDMVPGSDHFLQYESNTTIWFCSIYIMSGMALTAMCFNVVHDEIVHRIPPLSPNFGGLWEAGIKSVKGHLVRVVGEQLLTYEEFHTVSTQIEAILNSRPLGPISSDPNDVSALTPGHFLTLAPLNSLPDEYLTDIKMGRLGRWQIVKKIQQSFWLKWHREYLHTLLQRSKWTDPSVPIRTGDLVLLKDPSPFTPIEVAFSSSSQRTRWYRWYYTSCYY
ncbi:hypothetical protein JTB14_021495 [Gonioctena quinquepunctata]|nr:hypothetical protein JTB14_021495 [Gonioctena quinquepunctata]